MSEIERTIINGLCEHMARAQWRIHSVHDGGESVKASTPEEAMETIFSVSVSNLTFFCGTRRHAVQLVCGNGADIISDWSYSDGDTFNACMESYLDTLP